MSIVYVRGRSWKPNLGSGEEIKDMTYNDMCVTDRIVGKWGWNLPLGPYDTPRWTCLRFVWPDYRKEEAFITDFIPICWVLLKVLAISHCRVSLTLAKDTPVMLEDVLALETGPGDWKLSSFPECFTANDHRWVLTLTVSAST